MALELGEDPGGSVGLGKDPGWNVESRGGF